MWHASAGMEGCEHHIVFLTPLFSSLGGILISLRIDTPWGKPHPWQIPLLFPTDMMLHGNAAPP